jgi:hypothetical protein
LLVTESVVSHKLILSTVLMKAIRFSETSVHTRAAQRQIPEDDMSAISF